MNISVEQAKKFLPVPVELFSMVEEEMRAIESNISDDYIELEREIEFIWNGAQFGLSPVEKGDWEDGGKYQYSTDIYQLVSYKDKLLEEEVNKYNLFISIDISRSGFYFSDYYFQCQFGTYTTTCIIDVPEVIIPAHQEVNFTTFKEKD